LRHVPPAAYPHEAKIGAMYALFRLSRIEAMEAGADEALLLASDGSVAESPGASVFAIKAGVAYTPPIAVGILPSITRATAAAILTGHLATPVVEACLSPGFLADADEMFLTGTIDEIRPVRSLGGWEIGGGSAPLTSLLRDAYLRACRLGEPSSPAGTMLFAGGPGGPA
jgi:branched-chain amino acid aminotransferase